ncbi:hypothetical protein LCGC14_2524740 [marine sediment metagenome]|uniref:Uncharacterized protein n=1 Tax=marine sediment metagenome TaxID=412755 RepID=A0A0F9AVR3_9ZZZZ
MGMIKIETEGSFGHRKFAFSAQIGGHAQAVGEAILYLSKVILPEAIVKDHELHDNGVKPSNEDFSK